MRLLKIIALGLLLLPLAEVAAFLLVASLIGFGGAILLLILISLAGLAVLRRSGSAVAVRRAGGDPAGVAASRLAGRDGSSAVAGILLLLPGFITGVAGAVLLQASSRQWLLRTAVGRMTRQAPPSGPEVIDLSPDEWRSKPESKAPNVRSRRRGPQQ